MNNGKDEKDLYYKKNYKNSKDASNEIGAYFYSLAKTIKEAKGEGNYDLKILKDKNLNG